MSSTPTFKYGYVVGRFINSKGDSDDLDRFPDYVGAKLNPTFVRVRGQYVQPLDTPESGIQGAMVYHEPVVAAVTDEGFLTGDVDPTGRALPDAKTGIWLVIGRYNVNLGPKFPAMTIDVLESHTEDAPLDLSTEQKYVPPPGVIVNTLPLPSGGEPGQVYGWTGSSVGWYTPEEGPSAYEVALRNGFSGTVDAWLLSLKGAKGDPGISAYEVAQSQGFSGTVDEWLASLKGLKGDAGFSAYQLAKTNGFSGTVTEWLDSLVGRKGDPGISAYEVARLQGFSGTVDEWITSLRGLKGDPGFSAYQVATTNGFSGTVIEWLNSLVGRKGDPGPPGDPTAYVKVGPGRPDDPSSTAGTITGNEPVGTEYRSQDGASVGAFVWMKRPWGKWEVAVGDTGWRRIDSTGFTTGWGLLRRVGNTVTFKSAGPASSYGMVNLASKPGSGGNNGLVISNSSGFKASGKVASPLFYDGASIVGSITANDPTDLNGLFRIYYLTGTTTLVYNVWNLQYLTAEPWPTTLPGTPA